MSTRIYLLPLWLRLWHWTNASLILVLIVTGVSLHFAEPNLLLVPFALAARIHSTAGVCLAGLYATFVLANAISGNWWQYIPKPPGILRRCWAQILYYAFGILRGAPHPHEPSVEHNFNDLQSVIYFSVMYLLLPTVIGTGLLFLYPQAAPDRIGGLDGLLPIAVLHYVAGATITLFLIGHVYLGTTGHTATSLFKTMITGWHEGSETEPHP